jgi:hypothetical protein
MQTLEALVAGVVLARTERTPVILPSPRQKCPGGIIAADSPLTEGDSLFLGLGRGAHECVVESVAWYPEILFEQLDKAVIYAMVAGAAFTSGC